MKKVSLYMVVLFFGIIGSLKAQNVVYPEVEENAVEEVENITEEEKSENLIEEPEIVTEEEPEVIVEEPEIILNWENSFRDAVQKSRIEKKPILIYFTGSDWCGPCIRLKETLFKTEKFKDFSDKNIILYKADFPRNKDLVSPEIREANNELVSRYGQSSFPTMIIVNEQENVLGRKDGAYLADYYYNFFNEVLARYK
ncbi:MAG: thioredoxin family protein [Tenacibaculum sp.]|nr:thioredoxin family protein [Tenacibaculum sp.]